MDGLTTIEEFAEMTGYVIPEGPYDTVAGYFMAVSGTLPQIGQEIAVLLGPEGEPEGGVHRRFALAVTALDGRRAAWFSLREDLFPEEEATADA